MKTMSLCLLAALLFAYPVSAQQPPPTPTCDFSEWLAFLDDTMLPTMQETTDAFEANQTDAATLFRLYTELAFIRMSLENSDASITGCGEDAASLNNTAIALTTTWQDLIAFQIFGLWESELRTDIEDYVSARIERLADLMEQYNELRETVE